MTETDNSKKEPATPGKPPATSTQPDKSQVANQSAKSATKTETASSGQPGASTTGEKAKSAKEANQAKKDQSKAPAAKKPGTAKRPFPIIGSIALVLGLAVGAASYLNYNRWQATDLQSQSLANENSKLRNQLGELQNQISGLQRQDLDFNLQQQRLQDQFATDLKLQTDSMNQLSQQFQALAADKGKDPMLWRVAEVEYLLSVANHVLVLQRDVDTALEALQDADRRLEAIGDPALIPVRKLIASESTALKSVDEPDIAGMALRLSSLADNIEQLPLVSRERLKTDDTQDASQATIGSLREFLTKIKDSLKGVVSIRRSDQPIEPLLPPEEQHYLSQNLGLKLEEARIALLRRDTTTFRQNLSDSREWVQRYFDAAAAAVGNVVASVDEMQEVELKPPLPDISGSLRETRRWLKSQQQNRISALQTPVARPDSRAVSKSASSQSSSVPATESSPLPVPQSPDEATSGQEKETNI